jgi:hypothetical protein
VWDPGVKNPYLFASSGPGQPPPIPARRLFQIPDEYTGKSPSNASEGGDPFVNMQTTDGSLGALTSGRVNLVTPPTSQDVYLGSGAQDRRQSPYFRTEWLQSVMNLTTVLSHQFAVWITIGFFEVKRRGNPALAASNPPLAFDLLGREIGSPEGHRVRHRAFFVLDRTRASGMNPTDTMCIHDVVVHRRFIE